MKKPAPKQKLKEAQIKRAKNIKSLLKFVHQNFGYVESLLKLLGENKNEMRICSYLEKQFQSYQENILNPFIESNADLNFEPKCKIEMRYDHDEKKIFHFLIETSYSSSMAVNFPLLKEVVNILEDFYEGYTSDQLKDIMFPCYRCSFMNLKSESKSIVYVFHFSPSSSSTSSSSFEKNHCVYKIWRIKELWHFEEETSYIAWIPEEVLLEVFDFFYRERN
jgi:hypothetical protein